MSEAANGIGASNLSGARKAPFPREPRVQLATLVKDVPRGDEWLHEIKHDGYRLLCLRGPEGTRLLTRRGLDWTDRFPDVAREASELPVREAVLDGEVAVLRPDGTSDFQALQNALGSRRQPGLYYFVFDLLYCEGYDLRVSPLIARKELLRSLLQKHAGERLRFSDHVLGQGPRVLERACRLGAEGIVSKLAQSPYEPRRTRSWLKVKCVKRQEFVIAGFTEPEGSRAGFGSLVLGQFDAEGRLIFSGQVGTGFTEASLKELTARLRQLERKDSPLAAVPRELRRTHWVQPELVAEVEYTEWTGDGRLRHPSFKGLRDDKAAPEVGRENPGEAPGARSSE